MGTSKPWPEVLAAMTGKQKIDGTALIEYFKPLKTYLEKANAKSAEEEIMRQTLRTYSTTGVNFCNSLVTADWNVATDIENADKQEALIEAMQSNAAWVKEQHAQHFQVNYTDYDDVDISRQLRYLSKLGTDILNDAELRELRETNSKMETSYNTAKVCPYTNQNCNRATEGLILNPGNLK